MQIVLRFHIVRFGCFQLGVRSAQLLLGCGDCGAGILNARSCELQLADVFTEVIGTVIFSDRAVASALARFACACASAT